MTKNKSVLDLGYIKISKKHIRSICRFHMPLKLKVTFANGDSLDFSENENGITKEKINSIFEDFK